MSESDAAKAAAKCGPACAANGERAQMSIQVYRSLACLGKFLCSVHRSYPGSKLVGAILSTCSVRTFMSGGHAYAHHLA